MNKIAFILASTEFGPMIVNRLDFHQFADGGVTGVGAQILGTGGYHTEEESQLYMTMFALLKQHRPEPIQILDLGANIGACTVPWAKLVEPWGKVLAIEAQEPIFYALAGNIALNNCINARALHAAVAGHARGVVQVPRLDYRKAANFGGLSLLPEVEGGSDIGQPMDRSDSYGVRAVCVDGFGLPRVDFIKIDVEGMELEVLEGASSVIGRDRPILLIEHIKVGADAIKRALPDYQFLDARIDLCGIHKDDPILSRLQIREAA